MSSFVLILAFMLFIVVAAGLFIVYIFVKDDEELEYEYKNYETKDV